MSGLEDLMEEMLDEIDGKSMKIKIGDRIIDIEDIEVQPIEPISTPWKVPTSYDYPEYEIKYETKWTPSMTTTWTVNNTKVPFIRDHYTTNYNTLTTNISTGSWSVL